MRSYTEHLNAPVQGTAADGMKMALALLWERRDECPGAVPILAVHDEIVVECDEGDAEKVEDWLKKAMVDGMDAVVNATEPQCAYRGRDVGVAGVGRLERRVKQ